MSTCGEEGCDRPPRKRGRCEYHYRKALVAGEFGGAPCRKCEKRAINHGLCGNHAVQARRRGELPGATRCAVSGCDSFADGRSMCVSHRVKSNTYNLDVDQLSTLEKWLASYPMCLICRENEATRIDHCHETGNVRGLLCHWCNVGLGYFFDNTERLIAAAQYLNASRDAHERGTSALDPDTN